MPARNKWSVVSYLISLVSDTMFQQMWHPNRHTAADILPTIFFYDSGEEKKSMFSLFLCLLNGAQTRNNMVYIHRNKNSLHSYCSIYCSCSMVFLYVTKSDITEVGRDIWRSSCPTSCLHRAGPTSGWIRLLRTSTSHFRKSQKAEILQLLRAQVLNLCCCEEFFPYIQSDFPLL